MKRNTLHIIYLVFVLCVNISTLIIDYPTYFYLVVIALVSGALYLEYLLLKTN